MEMWKFRSVIFSAPVFGSPMNTWSPDDEADHHSLKKYEKTTKNMKNRTICKLIFKLHQMASNFERGHFSFHLPIPHHLKVDSYIAISISKPSQRQGQLHTAQQLKTRQIGPIRYSTFDPEQEKDRIV